ncbi:MAG: type II toxin-antitoxin system HicB family antitoxin [Spirochaetia bacterium]|nr:type II toxin-antitoxin system HicB family antitoxin [Spirochaetia bacterium]
MLIILLYKDFIGSVHYSAEDEIFFGKIEGINDLVTFESDTVKGPKESFIESVEDCIEICKSAKKEVYKSYKGSFNVRITPELHKRAVQKAQLLGISLNQFVEKAIEHETAVAAE